MYGFLITYKDFILLIASILSTVISTIVGIITYKNLKELRITRIEESRAYINFYIDKSSNDIFHSLILKNFGKSAGTVLSINMDPALKSSLLPITEYKNIYLAPNQSVKSLFDFRKYPDEVFDVTITYLTLGKTFTDKYKLDLSYRKSVLSGRKRIETELDALESIHQSIEGLSEKFL